ncbi:transmembrane protein adipocyte-associated 1 homolog [Ptychodera flava]|uniref:transmembrane protein adipocyte-associated 1 homolog n=1 Tax=Ptychodera flava TaxID=63121 RepID=UPI003969CFA6
MAAEVFVNKVMIDLTTFEANASDISNYSTVTTLFPSDDVTPVEVTNKTFPCLYILYREINNSGVRVWDVALLIPNVLYLLFLLINLRPALVKLRNSDSPIFMTFYILVFLVACIGIARCVVSMTISAASSAGSVIDKILWLVLKFFVLTTELSVLIFGLAFGHLDSKASIKRVMTVTTLIALMYSVTQGFLEIAHPDHRLQDPDKDFDLYGHGGMLFWFVSSAFFFVVYSCIFILPFTKLKEKILLPSKKSFYVYVFVLAVLNLHQATGAMLVYMNEKAGLCIVDVTTYLYFTCFAPLIYWTFLRDFFKVPATTILFSYKAQLDDGDNEVDMPHSYSTSSKDLSFAYDCTEFDGQSSSLVINSTDEPST